MKAKGSSTTRVWLGTAFMLAGLFIICVGTGLIPVDPLSLRAPRWVISLSGAVLVLSGLMAFVEVVGDAFVDPLAVLFILSFATVASWVALGGNDGAFYGSVALGPSPANGGTRELISRFAFGVGAVSLLALAAGISVRWLNELRDVRAHLARVQERANRSAAATALAEERRGN
ncbi:MAG: hypothetical protein ACC682_11760 [Gemmatimonadota bacterium]